MLKLKQAVGFAISQSALCSALPNGVELTAEPNQYGALLDPSIYRDIAISCMYLVEDIVKDMLVPLNEVPPFVIVEQTVHSASSPMFTPKKGKSAFKAEKKSDYSTGTYESSIKKIRKVLEYPAAKHEVTKMIGEDGDPDNFDHIETMYILRCLDTDCSSSSLFAGLTHYSSSLINDILLNDFNFRGEKVLKNKANLLLVCEAVLYYLDNKFP